VLHTGLFYLNVLMHILQKIFIFLSPFIFLSSFAQEIYFNKRIDLGHIEAAYSIVLAGSGYLVSSSTREAGKFRKLAIVKLDSQGDTVFVKKYETFGDLFSGRSNSLTNSSNNGFMLATTIQRQSEQISKDYLMKFDQNGDTLWTKTISEDSTIYFAGRQVRELEDGSLMYLMLSLDSSLTYHRMILAKLDSQGNKIWQKAYGTGPHHYIGTQLDKCHDGGFIIGGQREIGRYEYPYILKVDSLGNFEWEKDIGEMYGCSYTHCFNGYAYPIQLANGDIFAVATPVKYQTWNGLDFYQSRFVRYSNTGIKKWDKWYGQIHTYNYMGFPIELNDGSIVSGGQNVSKINTPIGAIFKINSQGDSLWWRNYQHPHDSSSSNYIRSIKQTPDGGFIAGGFVTRPQDIWVLKLDSMGCVEPLCHKGDTTITDTTVIDTTSTIGIFDFAVEEFKFVAYPNPSTGIFNFQYSLPGTKSANLVIFNAIGAAIRRETLHGPKGILQIDLSHLPSTIYYYSVEVEGMALGRGKLIITK
jgi:hypothetical protein